MPTKSSHSSLSEKLNLLYESQLSQDVQRHSQLAEVLCVSRQAVSKWIHGSVTTRGDRIPAQKVDELASIFKIPSQWLKLPLEEFQQKLARKVASKNHQSLGRLSDSAKDIDVSVSALPLTSEDAVGRDIELNLLSGFMKSEEINIVQIIGFGGMGKSTLVNAWLRKIATEEYLGLERVFAWSFDWQKHSNSVRASVDLFLESALEWFGDEFPAEGSPWSKANRLIHAIRTKKTLLVLDGFESLLSSPGTDGGRIEDRSMTILVREIATAMHGLCIITSRISMPDLAKFYCATIATIDLKKLDSSEAISLVKQLGARVSDEHFVKLVDLCQCHPLSLNLAAGYLSSVSATAYENVLQDVEHFFSVAPSDPHTNLMRVYEEWFDGKAELSCLFLLSLFSKSINLKFVRSIAMTFSQSELFAELASFEEADWRLAISKLQNAGLITKEVMSNDIWIDCHILVRNHFSELFQERAPEDWRQGHSHIFTQLTAEPLYSLTTRVGMEPLVQAISHGCMAGRYTDAFELFKNRIKEGKVTVTPMTSHYADLDCLAPFFKVKWTTPVEALPIEAKHYLSACAAANLIYLGKPQEAAGPMMTCIRGFVEQKDWVSAVTSAAPLATTMVNLGRLDEAEAMLTQMMSSVAGLNSPIASASAATFRAYFHYLRGKNVEAKELFDQSYQVISLEEAPAPATFPIVNFFHTMFLLETGDTESGLMHAEQTMKWREEGAWQTQNDTTVLRIMDGIALGYAYLKHDRLEDANRELDESTQLLRELDDWMYLPLSLSYRSLVHLALEEYGLAIADLNEALEICGTTGAKYIEWQVSMNLCLVEMAANNQTAVKELYKNVDSLATSMNYKVRHRDIEDIRSFLGF